MKRIAAILLATFLPFGAAQAAVVSYSESVSGDLSSSAPLKLFTLDVGANTVSGTFGLSSGVSDFDSFAFVVPTGTVLASGQVQFTDATGDMLRADWALRPDSLQSGDRLQFLTVDSPGTGSISAGLLPLAAGTYNFTQASYTRSDANSDATAAYVFTLTLRESVPAPATLALLGVGLAGLVVARRRLHAIARPTH